MLTKNSLYKALNEVLVSTDIQQQVVSGSVTDDLVEHGSEMTDAVRTIGEHEGRYMKLVSRIGLPGNANVPMDSNMGDAYPAAHESQLEQQLFVLAESSATVSLNDMAAKVSQSGKRAVVSNLIEREFKANFTAIRRRQNYFLLRGNGSALIGKVPASGNNWVDATGKLTVDDIRPFKIGMRLIPRKTAAGSVVTVEGNQRYMGDLLSDWKAESGLPMEVKVTAVDKVNSTITLLDKNGAALKDSGGSAIGATELNSFGLFLFDSQGRAPWGFQNFYGTGNPANMGYDHTAAPSGLSTLDLQIQHLFGGINRLDDANEWWRGQEVAATAAFTGATTTPSLQHWNALLDLIDERTEGDHGKVLCPVRQEMSNAILSDLTRQNYTNFTTKMPNGHGGYYDAIKWRFGYMVVDFQADPTLLPAIEVEQLFFLDAQPWQIDDTDNVYNRNRNAWGRGLPSFDVYLAWKGQRMSGRNLGHGCLTGFNCVK